MPKKVLQRVAIVIPLWYNRVIVKKGNKSMTKKKATFTIDTELLDSLQKYINDKDKVKSKVVEKAISEYLERQK